jgi:hypothetical protein
VCVCVCVFEGEERGLCVFVKNDNFFVKIFGDRLKRVPCRTGLYLALSVVSRSTVV